jgi:hypothetical protein
MHNPRLLTYTLHNYPRILQQPQQKTEVIYHYNSIDQETLVSCTRCLRTTIPKTQTTTDIAACRPHATNMNVRNQDTTLTTMVV